MNATTMTSPAELRGRWDRRDGDGGSTLRGGAAEVAQTALFADISGAQLDVAQFSPSLAGRSPRPAVPRPGRPSRTFRQLIREAKPHE